MCIQPFPAHNNDFLSAKNLFKRSDTITIAKVPCDWNITIYGSVMDRNHMKVQNKPSDELMSVEINLLNASSAIRTIFILKLI